MSPLTFPPPLDVRSIGLFRILLGIVLLADLIFFRLPYLSAFYADGGILTRDLGWTLHHLGLLDVLTSKPAALLFFALTMVAYILFTIGYKARLFGLLSLVCLWSIHQRSPTIIATDDQAIICLLFWSLFLPIGARFTPFATSDSRKGTTVAGLAAFAIVLQIAMIYFLNGYPKTGPTWSSGVALSYALMEDLWAKDSAEWLVRFTELCRLLTHTIKPIELSIPFLILCPIANHLTRFAAVVLIFIFHWSIFAFISLGFFPLITTAWAALLLPTFVWDRYIARWKWPERLPRIQMRPGSSPSEPSRAGKHVQRAVLVAALFVVVWQGSLKIDSLARVVPKPVFLNVLDETSLFSQHWALYAPDATIVSKWIKVKGLQRPAEAIDLWTGAPFAHDNSGLRAYHIEPWQNLAWHILYQPNDAGQMAGNWARYEYERWNRAHPDRPVDGVQVVAFSRTILGPLRTTPVTWEVIADYRAPASRP